MRKIVAGLALVLSACAGAPFKWDDARKIRPAMTTQEVTAIMGSPSAVRAEGDVLRYVWVEVNMLSASTKTISVDFKDGKVVKVPPIPDEFK